MAPTAAASDPAKLAQLQRNREAAAKCRQKKKDASRALTKQYRYLEACNPTLKLLVQQLQQELFGLSVQATESKNLSPTEKAHCMQRAMELREQIDNNYYYDGVDLEGVDTHNIERPWMRVEARPEVEIPLAPETQQPTFRRSMDPTSSHMIREGAFHSVSPSPQSASRVNPTFTAGVNMTPPPYPWMSPPLMGEVNMVDFAFPGNPQEIDTVSMDGVNMDQFV